MSQSYAPGRCPMSFTIFDPNVQNDPYRYYNEMHEKDPVHYDEVADLYLVTKHDLIVQAARDVETFSSEIDMRKDVGGPSTDESDKLFEQQGYVVKDVLTQVDPPRHTIFRRMVDRLFIGPVANEMEDYIEKHVDDLIDGFIDKGKVDFLAEFATPLPLDLIADQLGVPREDNERFRVWTDAIIETLGIMLTPERKLECTRLIIDFQHYFAKKLAEKKDNSDNDIISFIATTRVEEEDRDTTVEEKLALIQQLLVAGNETTRNHLAKCMLLLIENPELQARLRDDSVLIKNFVEESLRIESPVQGIFRITTKETILGGTELPKGAKLLLMFGAANRDGEFFEEPQTLDVDRQNAKRHLAFSYGIHTCIGAMLARKELNVSIYRILNRMKNIQLADSTTVHQHNLTLSSARSKAR